MAFAIKIIDGCALSNEAHFEEQQRSVVFAIRFIVHKSAIHY